MSGPAAEPPVVPPPPVPAARPAAREGRPAAAPLTPWGRRWADWERPAPPDTPPAASRPGRARRAFLRWPVLLLVLAAVAVGVLTDLSRPATATGRLSDLRAYYLALHSDVASCAGGLRDSLTALEGVLDGTATNRTAAQSVALAGAAACSPVSNTALIDAATTPPPRSLAGYRLASLDGRLSAWAYPDAALAVGQVYRLLARRQGPGSPPARRLYAQLRALNATAAGILGQLQSVAARLHGSLPALDPPLLMPVPAVLLFRPGG